MGVIRNHSFIAVEVTNHLKSIVRSPIVQGAVKLTPTKFDDKILAILEGLALPVLKEVVAVHYIIKEYEKNSIAIDQIIFRLKQINPDLEGKVYADFAARLNYRLADGTITLAEAWEQAQDTFFTFFKK